MKFSDKRHVAAKTERTPAARRRKSGMTIIETVISLAVIAIISATAIGFIGRFSDVNAKMIYETDARLVSENALECFKYAKNEEQFAGALSLARSGFERKGGTYVYTDYNFTVTLAVSFPEGGGRATFTCRTTDSDGKTIVAIEQYAKEVSP